MKKILCFMSLVMSFFIHTSSQAMEAQEREGGLVLFRVIKMPPYEVPTGLELSKEEKRSLFRDYCNIFSSPPPSEEPNPYLILSRKSVREWQEDLKKYVILSKRPWGCCDWVQYVLHRATDPFIGSIKPPIEVEGLYQGLLIVNLSHSELGGTGEETEGKNKMIWGIGGCSPHLQRLDLSCNKLSDFWLKENLLGVSTLAPLKDLNLSHNLIEGKGDTIILLSITFNKLETLDLSHNHLGKNTTPTDIEDQLNTLYAMSKLENLNLDKNAGGLEKFSFEKGDRKKSR